MKTLFARFVVAAMMATGIAAVPAAASAHEGCDTPEDVPVVLEFGELDGEDRVVCAQHGAGTTAIEALHEAGLETTETAGTPPMVCRIEGRPAPADEKCGNALNGSGYWAFMVAKEGEDWNYASVGLQDYELAAGDFVALKYHQMADGENVEVALAADADTRADAVLPGAEEGETEESSADDDTNGSFVAFAFPAAIVVVLLAGVGAFVLTRRRRA